MMTDTNKTDISQRQDVQLVLRHFYTKAFDDPIIGFMFTDIAQVDLSEHVALITDFWSSILFADRSYQRNAMQKHIDLNKKVPLKPGHFTRWLYLFEQSVDLHYQGETAQLMKDRAHKIANSISDSLAANRGEPRKGVDTLAKLLG